MLSTTPCDRFFLSNGFDSLHDYVLPMQKYMCNPIVLYAEMIMGLMFLHHTSEQQHDSAEFIKAMVREVYDHNEKKF